MRNFFKTFSLILLVMLSALDLEPQAILNELERRFGLSGHAEKAARTTT